MSTRTTGRVTILFMFCAMPAFAQASQYPAPGDGLGAANGRTRTPAFYSARIGPRTLTARDLNGPPAPDAMRALVSLDPGQLSSYSLAYDALMRDTRGRRDSARIALQARQEADAAHDRAAVEKNTALLRRLEADIANRDAAFDKSLNAILTKEQQRRYYGWGDALRKDAARSR